VQAAEKFNAPADDSTEGKGAVNLIVQQAEKPLTPAAVPVPEMINGSAELIVALTSSVAPLDTVVVDRVDKDSPRAAAFLIRTVPSVIDVAPV
jgi:hypothetical protein